MIMANKPKKVLILGASGMLGSGIYSVLKDKYDLVLSFRDLSMVKLLDQKYGGVDRYQIEKFDLNLLYDDYRQRKGYESLYFKDFLKRVGDIDCVINAIGVITPHALKDPAMTFFANSAFPFILSNIFKEKLIHITTICSFNGKEGYPYDEKSPKSPEDVYDLSKSLGEPTECLTLRSSMVGKELREFKGLLEWFLQQEGKTINGFTKYIWNGLTTKEFGNICYKIIENRERYPLNGIYHIFADSISKYDMLLKFREKYNIKCEIVPDDTVKINRTLSTIYPLCSQLEIPSFDEMLKDYN